MSLSQPSNLSGALSSASTFDERQLGWYPHIANHHWQYANKEAAPPTVFLLVL